MTDLEAGIAQARSMMLEGVDGNVIERFLQQHTDTKNMKTITPGHRYELENFEDKNKPGQTIQFIEKAPVFDCLPGEDPAPSGRLATVNDGTTNEEVLRVLIDRLGTMQAKFPCRENAIVTTHLETALLWLEKRTADRKARGVEGTHQK